MTEKTSTELRELSKREQRALALGERLLRYAKGGSVDSLAGLVEDARWYLVDMDEGEA